MRPDNSWIAQKPQEKRFPRTMEYDLENPEEYIEFFRKYIGFEHYGSVAKAFQETTFVYGTTGGGSMIGLAIKRFGEAIRKKRAGGSGLNFYNPGHRVNEYMSGSKKQMMDLYCGQEGTNLHESRDPTIGKYVHRAMEFVGDYDQHVSGIDAYAKTHGSSHKPWQEVSAGNDGRKHLYYHKDKSGSLIGMTGTQEMSRVIRAAIKYFGGTLIFDGACVYYYDVFTDAANVYRSDTMLEARALFPYFSPGRSSVPYGKGTLVFHWSGQETIPSHAKFETNWRFATVGKTNLTLAQAVTQQQRAASSLSRIDSVSLPAFHMEQNQRKLSDPGQLLPIWNCFATKALDDDQQITRVRKGIQALLDAGSNIGLHPF